MERLKVGQLVPIRILKDLPKDEALLATIVGTCLTSFLPKRFSNGTSRVGNVTFAIVYSIENRRIILSQRSAQYFRKLTEHLLAPLISAKKVQVKRAATTLSANFAKVAVRALSKKEDPIKNSLPYIMKYSKYYTDASITLVRYSSNFREYVINSLSPAPREGVREVVYIKTTNKVLVRVDPEYMGIFLGPRGLNAVLSSKLLGVNIEINKFRPENPEYPVSPSTDEKNESLEKEVYCDPLGVDTPKV